MPAITVDIAGLSLDQKRQLVEKLSRCASEVTGIRPEAFYIFINEYGRENIAVGPTLLADKKG